MKPLRPPDNHYLNSALGWLELGNYLEADAELDNIAPPLRAHPDVLKIRWRVYAQANKWESCLEFARTVTELEPEKAGGWIDYAQSLHRLNRTEEAYDLLSFVADRFPEVPTVFYHLAVYGCHLRKVAEAWAWLERAFHIGHSDQIKLQALDDSDLEPLWAEISEI
jgi:predicted Zn-dependent protease